MIKPVGGGKYAVFSHKTGKRLSKPMSKKAATKRLRQIQWFKYHGSGTFNADAIKRGYINLK